MVQPLPMVGGHEHVDARVDSRGAVLGGAARQLPVTVPVADHEARKSHPSLEHVGEERSVAVHLVAVPARIGGHHRQHPRIDRTDVALGVKPDQLLLADPRVALIHAVAGAAIAQKMLGRGRHSSGLQLVGEIGRTLQSLDCGPGILAHQGRILGKTLVAAAPAHILRDGQRRSECPVDARGRNFLGGGRADSPHQVSIVRRAQADIVRIQDGSDHVAVSVYGIDAEQQRNRFVAVARFERYGVILMREAHPGLGGRAIVPLRP